MVREWIQIKTSRWAPKLHTIELQSPRELVFIEVKQVNAVANYERAMHLQTML